MTIPVIYRPNKDIAGVRPLFVLPDESQIAYFDEHGGAPEAELITWAESLLPDGRLGAFVDVGSHIGTWSITFDAAGHVVWAFEAQAWLSRLQEAATILNDSSFRVENRAVGEMFCQVQLTAPYADGGGGSIVRHFDNAARTETVHVIPLDSRLITVDILKIDVEGAELDVLKGGKQTIFTNKPKILFECWNDERGQRREELFKYLKDDLKYEVQPISWTETYLATPK